MSSSTLSFFTSVTTAPPKPAPVNFDPNAPKELDRLTNLFNSLVETVKNLSEREDVPSNIFLTSELMHSKTIGFYLDAIDKNS